MLPAISAQAAVSNAMYMQSERFCDAAVALIEHLLLLCRDTMSRSCAELLNGQRILLDPVVNQRKHVACCLVDNKGAALGAQHTAQTQ